MFVDIGASRPVECRLFATDVDLASGLIELSARAFDELEVRIGPVFAKRVQRISSTAIDLSPQLALSWRYRAGSGVGLIKHRIASVGGRGVYCRHAETGYRETFAAMFEIFVRNLRWEDRDLSAPRYESVMRLKVEDKPRGVGSLVVTELDDGTVRSERRSAILTSSPYGTVTSVDTVVVGFSRPDGTLINSVYARSENGVLVADLALDPRDDGWVVSGTLAGAEVGVGKVGSEALLSVPGQVRALRNAMRKRGASTSFEVHGWFPLLKPDRPERRVVVLGQRRDAEHFEVISKIDSVVVESVVDLSGQTTWSRWVDEEIGPVETELLRARGRIDSEESTSRSG